MTDDKRRGYRIEIIGPEKFRLQTHDLQPDSITTPTSLDESELLLIDGEPTPFLKTEQGYRIFFQPPAPTLIEAAKRYVDTQREKPE